MNSRAKAAIAALFLAFALPHTSLAADSDVLRATLDNGLKVVIVRNTLAPVVSTSVNYLVGANETPEGFPGMAHAQEHMMFRGSPGLSADQLADIGSLMGGSFNANTRQTITQYLYTVPSEDLDVALHIEAARMEGVDDLDSEWKTERGAIEQEVAADLSSPTYVLFTKLRKTMFAGTPYDHDALGSKESFDQTTGAMLKAFHDKWYAPNNAVLVVAGDLDPKATLATIKDLFGKFPKKKLPKRPDIKLQPITPTTLKLDSDLPYGLRVIAIRLPGFESKDYGAIEVLSDILNSARGPLYQLVIDGKALGVNFSFDPQSKASLAYLSMAYPAGQDGAALEKEVRQVIAGIVKNGVSQDLLTAAKIREKSDAEFQKNSIAGLASVWSEAVAVQGLKSPDDDLKRIDKVSLADVNRAARSYLGLDNVVTAVLTPTGSGKPVAGGGFGGQESIAIGSAKGVALPEWAETALRRLSLPKSSRQPVVSMLPNGIKLVVQPEDVSNTVSVYGHILNRAELSVPEGKDGLSQVLDGMFNYGTEQHSREAFQEALDAIGADESSGTSFSVQSLAGKFDEAVSLLAEHELHPAFGARDLAIVKAQTAAAVAGRLKSPGYLSGRAILAAIYPPEDPTQRQATPKTVGSITMADVKDYYAKVFRPDMSFIVVIGNVTPEKAKAVIEKHFGSWSATGTKPDVLLPKVPLSEASTTAVPDRTRVQDTVTVAETLGLTRLDPDYYALHLGNTVLGGSFYASRLSRDLRKNAGLVYSVGSYIQSSQTRAVYVVSYACDPANVQKVHDAVGRELDAMRTTPVSEDELHRAKAVLLRQIPLGESSESSIAGGYLSRLRLDLPLDEPMIAARRYMDLDAKGVQASFAKWVRPDALALVSRGPAPQ